MDQITEMNQELNQVNNQMQSIEVDLKQTIQLIRSQCMQLKPLV